MQLQQGHTRTHHLGLDLTVHLRDLSDNKGHWLTSICVGTVMYVVHFCMIEKKNYILENSKENIDCILLSF